MSLIDADALGIGKANRKIFNDPKYADGWNSVIEIINNAPTIDPIHAAGGCYCRDCQHMEIEKSNNGRYCHVWGFYNGDGDDGFCNYGVRKDGGG